MSSASSLPNQTPPQKKRGCSSVLFWMMLWFVGGIFLLIIIVGLISNITGQASSPSEDAKSKFLQLASEHQNLIQKIKINPNFDKNGCVVILHGKIENTSDVAVKDIVIKYSDYAESGTQLDSKTETIYRVILPHKIIDIGSINLGFINSQAAHPYIEIIDAVEN